MRGLWHSRPRAVLSTSSLLTALVVLTLARPCYFSAQDKPASSTGSAQITKAVGVIKSIQADSITVAAESGGEVTAKLMGSTKILRVPPGEKDLKNATALQAQDLQPGDRVLVRGPASTDGGGQTTVIAALAVIVMKQADVTAKQQHDRDDWQKRGVGGLVTKVDAATDIITISTGGMGVNRSIAIHIAKDTILRRYAPDSVNFDDAKPAPATEFMAQIKAGDQLRARGTRSPDGSEVSAEEVVAGAFRNIAGTIKAIDASTNTMTVQDAISKGAVVVKVSPDSQMKKLPAGVAQLIAMRLKGIVGKGSGDQAGANGQGQTQGQTTTGQVAAPGGGGARPAPESQAGRGAGGNGPPDLQRMLSRLPNSTLADLQKGDAVMIVSTEGGDSGVVTAITLLAGVEAILTAAPNRSASSLLSPWSLGASGGEGEAAQP
ncbi:MAG: hypothetical protein WBZ01_20560 [Terriglobales bacterium]|jgi:hypothetical protein